MLQLLRRVDILPSLTLPPLVRQRVDRLATLLQSHQSVQFSQLRSQSIQQILTSKSQAQISIKLACTQQL